jgi:hypothetical protein
MNKGPMAIPPKGTHVQCISLTHNILLACKTALTVPGITVQLGYWTSDQICIPNISMTSSVNTCMAGTNHHDCSVANISDPCIVTIGMHNACNDR